MNLFFTMLSHYVHNKGTLMHKTIVLLSCVMSLAILPACGGKKSYLPAPCTQEEEQPEFDKHKEIGLED